MALALLDTNVLVYASYRRSPLYEPAAILLDRALRRRGLFCIAPQNLVEFAAVVTRRRPGGKPLSGQDVLRITQLLYRSRTLIKIYPKRGTVARALEEGARLQVYGSSWYDTFLALTMHDAGVRTIITENVSDFARLEFISAHRIADAARAGV
jgi:predicted nucleic acid-binding protein